MIESGIKSAREQARLDRAIAELFPAPTLKGKIKISVMPEKAIFYCRQDQYNALSKKLIERYPKSTIKRLEE